VTVLDNAWAFSSPTTRPHNRHPRSIDISHKILCCLISNVGVVPPREGVISRLKLRARQPSYIGAEPIEKMDGIVELHDWAHHPFAAALKS
jgi:hypothetical protein